MREADNSAFCTPRQVGMSDEENSSYSSESSFPFDDDNVSISTIKPYQFEPEFSSSEEREEEKEAEEDPPEDENARTRNLDW